MFLAEKRKLPSKKKDFDAKYSPMGRVIIKIVKNSSVFRTDTREPSFLEKRVKLNYTGEEKNNVLLPLITSNTIKHGPHYQQRPPTVTVTITFSIETNTVPIMTRNSVVVEC